MSHRAVIGTSGSRHRTFSGDRVSRRDAEAEQRKSGYRLRVDHLTVEVIRSISVWYPAPDARVSVVVGVVVEFLRCGCRFESAPVVIPMSHHHRKEAW